MSTIPPTSESLTVRNVSYDAFSQGTCRVTPTTKTAPATPILACLVCAYFASGAVGLLDEVIFFKYLSLTFGATAYASSAVLVAFMGGLAGGAALAALLDARVDRPLRLYGVLEIAVGLACAVSPWLFAAVARAYLVAAAGSSSLLVLQTNCVAFAGTGLETSFSALLTLSIGLVLLRKAWSGRRDGDGPDPATEDDRRHHPRRHRLLHAGRDGDPPMGAQ